MEFDKLSYYPKDATIVNAKVIEIVEHNKEYPDCVHVYKNVFYCDSKSGTPKLCISWGRSAVAEGDTVQLLGRNNKDGTFICYKIIILSKGNKNERNNGTN